MMAMAASGVNLRSILLLMLVRPWDRERAELKSRLASPNLFYQIWQSTVLAKVGADAAENKPTLAKIRTKVAPGARAAAATAKRARFLDSPATAAPPEVFLRDDSKEVPDRAPAGCLLGSPSSPLGPDRQKKSDIFDPI